MENFGCYSLEFLPYIACNTQSEFFAVGAFLFVDPVDFCDLLGLKIFSLWCVFLKKGNGYLRGI